ncbi:hypothetical protein ACKLNO_00545 [Neisseriaceae bacterium B1]
MAGIRQCFDTWREYNGIGKYEDSRIINQAITFLQTYADSPRFADWESIYTNKEHADYRKELDDKTNTEYWIILAVFETEILHGIDKRKGCQVLHGICWLKKPNGNGHQHQRFQKGRFYVLTGIEPPENQT